MKVAGALERRGKEVVFIKRVKSELHLLHLPEPSWAFDVAVLKKAEAAGATRVEVHDESGCVWWCDLPYLLKRGELLDRGHGRQVALPLHLWSFLPTENAARQAILSGEVRR